MVCFGGACLQNKRVIRVRPAASRLRQQFWPKASLRRKSLLHLHSVFGRSLVYGCDCDLVPELAKGSRQHAGALLLSLRIRFGALLDKSNPLNARSSTPRDRADGRLPRWRIDSPVEAADAGTLPENGCLSSLPQRGPPGSAPVADIYSPPRSGCCGSLRRFRPSPDRFPPKRSTPPLREMCRPVLPLPRLPAAPNPLRNQALPRVDHRLLVRLHGLRDQAVELLDLCIDQLQTF